MSDERIEGEERQKMIEEGLRLGYEGADRAADAAGELWKAEALEAFIRYAKRHKKLTSEDVRLANPDIRCNGDNRSWGHIAKAANRAGVTVKAGHANCISARVHGTTTTLWESLIFEGND
jgi:hypothetical protein